MTGSTLTLPVPRDFDLVAAVTTYGYFVLAPNHWHAARRELSRPLVIDPDQPPVHIAVTHPRGRRLRIACDRLIDRPSQATVKKAVRRMLRVDESLGPFHRMHPAARRRRFGRLFRSPTLFEDIVKTITGCNVAWANTKTMNRLLCDHVGRGAFPTAKAIASVEPGWLKATCKVGYRAERIVRLARDVEAGGIDLEAFETSDAPTEQLHKQLMQIHGIGDYAAANVCQHLGRYDRLAIDSETYRHAREKHGLTGEGMTPRQLDDAIRGIYEKYEPYQFLAYWFELWGHWEDGGV